jgi:hypothetical protein
VYKNNPKGINIVRNKDATEEDIYKVYKRCVEIQRDYFKMLAKINNQINNQSIYNLQCANLKICKGVK